jgi:hypothetical protein
MVGVPRLAIVAFVYVPPSSVPGYKRLMFQVISLIIVAAVAVEVLWVRSFIKIKGINSNDLMRLSGS